MFFETEIFHKIKLSLKNINCVQKITKNSNNLKVVHKNKIRF